MAEVKRRQSEEGIIEFHGLHLPKATVPYHLSPYSYVESGISGARTYNVARPAMLWAAQGGMSQEMKAFLLTISYMLDLGDAEGAICEALITQGMDGEVAEFLMENMSGDGSREWSSWEIMPLSGPLVQHYILREGGRFDEDREGVMRPPALEVFLHTTLEQSAISDGRKPRNFRNVYSPAFSSPKQWQLYLGDIAKEMNRQLSDDKVPMNYLCYGPRLLDEMALWCSRNYGVPWEWRNLLSESNGVIRPARSIAQELFKLHELLTPPVITDGVAMGEVPWLLEYNTLVEEYNTEWAAAAFDWSKYQGESQVTSAMNKVLAEANP